MAITSEHKVDVKISIYETNLKYSYYSFNKYLVPTICQVLFHVLEMFRSEQK